ncbi:MAG: VacB/RNase II family 3'-5' exoribonuclease [Myxococcales bacterium]|nr:VacB/RNase II family 3'-5' exoribonuclease [Myxococcales bacterium]
MTRIQKERVIDVLRERAPRAMHVGEVCQRLGLSKSKTEQVVHALDDLRHDGLVREMPGRRYRLVDRPPLPQKPRDLDRRPAERKRDFDRRPRGDKPRDDRRAPSPVLPRELERRAVPRDVERRPMPGPRLTGRLSMTTRGFGFVTATDGGPDVFIPHPGIGPALHGDKVEVEYRTSEKGREGEIVSVLERRPTRITGEIVFYGRQAVFEPDDIRLRSPMRIEGPLPKSLGKDETVIAELVRFPQHRDDDASVRIVDVLGIRGITEVETKKIEIRENVVEEFSEEALAEARAYGESVTAAEKRGRVDLRDLDLVTIDPPDARDHDDALYAEPAEKGGVRIVVAIADVSHYVRPGTALEAEAMARATSIYLPTRAIPMLPPELSSGLASLLPKKDRLCLALDVELGPKGNIRDYRIVEGVMRSRAKLTYEGVARALGLTQEGKRDRAAESRLPMLELMHEAAKTLRQKRIRRGALDFDLPEPKVVLDEAGVEPIDVVRARRDPGVREAYRIVEEMMLLANEVIAADLTERGVPAIYRVHGVPDPHKVELFCRLATSLGYDLEPQDAEDPRKLGRFLEKIEGTPQAPTLRYLLLRSMQQAVYQTTPRAGHFGLAARDYLHFTSPIRRYPDLAVHRVVRSVIRREPIDAAVLLPKLRMMAAESSHLERRAMSVERDVVDLYRTLLMRDRVGERFQGRVSSVDTAGFYVECDAPFVEIFVPIETLGQDHFELDHLGIRLVSARSGRVITLGDRTEVELKEVSIKDRKLRGALVVTEVEEPKGRKRRRARSRAEH